MADRHAKHIHTVGSSLHFLQSHSLKNQRPPKRVFISHFYNTSLYVTVALLPLHMTVFCCNYLSGPKEEVAVCRSESLAD